MQCLKKTKNKTKIHWLYSVQIFILSVQTTKSPHIPLSGKVGQISKRTRVLCWSIYIISVCPFTHQSPSCAGPPLRPGWQTRRRIGEVQRGRPSRSGLPAGGPNDGQRCEQPPPPPVRRQKQMSYLKSWAHVTCQRHHANMWTKWRPNVWTTAFSTWQKTNIKMSSL